MVLNPQHKSRSQIDWAAAEKFLGTKYDKKKPSASTFKSPKERPAALEKKHEEDNKLAKRAREDQNLRRERFRHEYPAFARWERFCLSEAKSRDIGIVDSRMDVDYSDAHGALQLHLLPYPVRKECWVLFLLVVDRAWRNMGKDYLPPLFRPVPANWRTDADQFWLDITPTHQTNGEIR